MATQPESGPMEAAQNLPIKAESTAPAENPGAIKRNSLQLSGASNLVADLLMMWSGVKNKSKSTTLGGALYTLGGLNLAVFGKARAKDKEDRLTRDTAEFLQEKTGHLSQEVAQAKAQAEGSNSLSKNAARNTLYAYTAGALAFLTAGIKKFRAGEGWGLMAYGASSTFFKVASLMVPEKTAKEKQLEGPNQKKGFVNWIREKPLRIFGYGSLVTDTMLGIETYQEYKNPGKAKADKNYRVIGGATVFYLLADYLMAQSSKDPANVAGKLDAKAQDQVQGLAAKAIAAEPEEKQGELLEQVSHFLAGRPEIRGSAQDITLGIKEKMGQKDRGDWVARTQGEQDPLTLSR